MPVQVPEPMQVPEPLVQVPKVQVPKVQVPERSASAISTSAKSTSAKSTSAKCTRHDSNLFAQMYDWFYWWIMSIDDNSAMSTEWFFPTMK